MGQRVTLETLVSNMNDAIRKKRWFWALKYAQILDHRKKTDIYVRWVKYLQQQDIPVQTPA